MNSNSINCLFVTGGAGFIGSAVIRELLRSTTMLVVNIDSLTYAGNKDNLQLIENYDNYSFIIDDICNRESLSKAIINFKPNIIIHFAAESHVDRSIKDPFKFIKTNVLGTSILLNESLQYYNSLLTQDRKQFKFIHISTDEVYGSIDDGSFTEECKYYPNSPYSASKASADMIIRSFNKTYGLNTTTSICSNNYGPYQNKEKFIPKLIDCLINNIGIAGPTGLIEKINSKDGC